MGGEPHREPHRIARWLSDATGVRRTRPGLVPRPRPRTTPDPPHAEPGEPEALGAAPVDPGARLPDAMAVIKVVRGRHPNGREAFGFSARCEGLAPLPYTTGPTQLRPAGIGLGNARAGGEAPSELLRAIRHWSRNQRRLADWINRARAAHGSALHLLVWDDTGYELPWETLWLPADSEHDLEEGLLGALVVMSRWTTIHELDRGLPHGPGDCAGGILGYYHRGMHHDIAAFRPYSHQPHTTMSGFLDALDRRAAGDPTGLVYMACHGTYDERVSALSLAEVTWAELDERAMAVLDEHRSLVCLNACHSGRFVDNDAGGEEALRGFAELFLRKGAGGCIVTAGKVGDHEARDLITELVEEVTARPRLPVTQALRAFRARALDDFGPLTDIPRTRHDDGGIDKEGQKRVLRLLYTFMFQYYGHPLTTLLLTGGPGEDGSGEDGSGDGGPGDEGAEGGAP
ncbi:CHAT domain-containing protein [Streptomyces sp. NPDC056244]|uniref:CHAT domain-containing protein n=1 Tax=Streptomyces sp. NPDC056244 TaxID=3345762 RepID=UPI0035D6E62B